jgi:hypothetical protein
VTARQALMADRVPVADWRLVGRRVVLAGLRRPVGALSELPGLRRVLVVLVVRHSWPVVVVVTGMPVAVVVVPVPGSPTAHRAVAAAAQATRCLRRSPPAFSGHPAPATATSSLLP